MVSKVSLEHVQAGKGYRLELLSYHPDTSYFPEELRSVLTNSKRMLCIDISDPNSAAKPGSRRKPMSLKFANTSLNMDDLMDEPNADDEEKVAEDDEVDREAGPSRKRERGDVDDDVRLDAEDEEDDFGDDNENDYGNNYFDPGDDDEDGDGGGGDWD